MDAPEAVRDELAKALGLIASQPTCGSPFASRRFRGLRTSVPRLRGWKQLELRHHLGKSSTPAGPIATGAGVGSTTWKR